MHFFSTQNDMSVVWTKLNIKKKYFIYYDSKNFNNLILISCKFVFLLAFRE